MSTYRQSKLSHPHNFCLFCNTDSDSYRSAALIPYVLYTKILSNSSLSESPPNNTCLAASLSCPTSTPFSQSRPICSTSCKVKTWSYAHMVRELGQGQTMSSKEWWYTHTHTCTHTHMYTHTRTHTHRHIHTHTHSHTHAHTHTHTQTHTHTCTDTHTHTHTCTHTHTHIKKKPYIYIYIYIYTHTHTHTHIYIYIYIYIYIHRPDLPTSKTFQQAQPNSLNHIMRILTISSWNCYWSTKAENLTKPSYFIHHTWKICDHTIIHYIQTVKWTVVVRCIIQGPFYDVTQNCQVVVRFVFFFAICFPGCSQFLCLSFTFSSQFISFFACSCHCIGPRWSNQNCIKTTLARMRMSQNAWPLQLQSPFTGLKNCFDQSAPTFFVRHGGVLEGTSKVSKNGCFVNSQCPNLLQQTRIFLFHDFIVAGTHIKYVKINIVLAY